MSASAKPRRSKQLLVLHQRLQLQLLQEGLTKTFRG